MRLSWSIHSAKPEHAYTNFERHMTIWGACFEDFSVEEHQRECDAWGESVWSTDEVCDANDDRPAGQRNRYWHLCPARLMLFVGVVHNWVTVV